MRAILIGGTSHVGKSTFATQLGEKLGWDVMSTDGLARHPGRPWRKDGVFPEHVREYFGERSTETMLGELGYHFESIVWPIVEAVVRARIANPYDDCLVFEGSAILPRCVARARLDRARAVWLSVSDDLIVERMRANSSYLDRSSEDRVLIDGFLSRTLAFNRYVLEAARDLGLPVADVGDEASRTAMLEVLAAEACGEDAGPPRG